MTSCCLLLRSLSSSPFFFFFFLNERECTSSDPRKSSTLAKPFAYLSNKTGASHLLFLPAGHVGVTYAADASLAAKWSLRPRQVRRRELFRRPCPHPGVSAIRCTLNWSPIGNGAIRYEMKMLRKEGRKVYDLPQSWLWPQGACEVSCRKSGLLYV